MSTAPPRAERDHLVRLRADLTAAGFTVDGVADLLGPLARAALDREHPLPAQRVTTAADSPLSTLVRLFTLGDAVDEQQADDAFPTLGVAGARALGLVTLQGPGVVATCELRPHADETHQWWVASDLSEVATRRPLREDHVLGLGGASTTLASWTPRPSVARALDIGTGCGVQALHLSTHADLVVATDLSARALGFAAFNAAFNQMHWELRAGSMLDPVAGERFDLVVSNPPFVITPRGAGVPHFAYRDGGASGDTVVADLVRSVGDHLEPGGIAQFLGNWEIPADADWREQVGGWVEGTGLDAWVIQREVQDPAQYAETWARDGGHHSATAEFSSMYAAWLDDFASRQVRSIGFGVITLQRPSSDRAPFVDLVEALHPVDQPMGPHVLAGLHARVWLAEHSEDELLAEVWVCAADVTEERHARPGVNDPSVIQLRQGSGLRRVIRLDTVLAAFVSVCDGDLTAGQALTAIAALTEAEPADVCRDALPVIRACIADGLLLPAGT